ncbi:chromosome segregation protein SMC [Bacillus cereus]|uniref:chromosome segregation protein SMC n=1 Tax=Bacillus cereus TaxID=1396 RepID=UPI0005E8DB29|nr:chromosome segregation protein SMC [Bacillus cereus]MDZ4424555.1 chromosome segregation protein SMC [Bacillus cereus]CJV59260.1 Uncharacterised protein [Streptococcus pneumoniae]
MTEDEKKLIQQIYEKVCDMEKTVGRVEDSLVKSDSKMDKLNGETSVDGKLDDIKSVYKDLQNTFTKGFADVNEGLAEIKEVKQIKKSGKQVH